MAKRRGRRRQQRLLLLVAAVLFAEFALVVSLFVFPGVTPRLQEAMRVATEWWSGSEDTAGMEQRVSGILDDAYSEVVEPMRPLPLPEPAGGEAVFSSCVSCHPDYAASKRIGSLYMDHPLHAAQGVRCSSCHEDVQHPDPLPVTETACVSCHQPDVERGGDCSRCHAPGSLPHFYLLGMDRDDRVDCDTCHTPGSLDRSGQGKRLVEAGSFDGRNEALCASCHTPRTCDTCHGEPHSSEWKADHERGGADDVGTCTQCHTDRWCGERCHARSEPLPTVDPSTAGGAGYEEGAPLHYE